MNPRIFTIEEAATTLDEHIKPALDRLYRSIEDLQSERRRGTILDLIVDSGAGHDSPDRRIHARCLDRIAELQASVRAEVSHIRATGAVFRDVRRGLIDFHAHIDGRLACLCWQRGEKTIAHWHPLHTGFAARRPLAQRTSELDDA